MSERDEKPRLRGIVFGAYVAAIALAFPFVDNIFATRVSAGLAFILTAALAMVTFVVFGSLFRRQEGLTRRGLDKDKTNSAVAALMVLVAIAGAASWGAMAYIETNALSQPDHTTGAFTVAVHLKGVVRYMTPEQRTIDQIANWTFFGCVFGPLVAVLTTRVWQRQRNDGR